jgi:hypothetical protein
MNKGDVQVDPKRFDSKSDSCNRNRNISSDKNQYKIIKSDLAIEIVINLVFAIPITVYRCFRFLIKKKSR